MSRRGIYEEITESEIMTEISTFLAGILFTSIILIFQIKDDLKHEFVFIKWQTGKPFYEILVCSLSITCIFFIFLALSTIMKNERKLKVVLFQIIIFFISFISFFISLYLILSQISQMAANISLVLSIILFMFWINNLS